MNLEGRKGNKSILTVLYENREIFKKTYEMYASMATFGCSTATCESTSSTLTAINRPQRLSMTHKRLANLVFLAFERNRTKDLNLNLFLKTFNNNNNRKLQIF